MRALIEGAFGEDRCASADGVCQLRVAEVDTAGAHINIKRGRAIGALCHVYAPINLSDTIGAVTQALPVEGGIYLWCGERARRAALAAQRTCEVISSDGGEGRKIVSV